MSKFGALLMGLGALVLWLASRMTWLTAHYADNLTGDGSAPISGADWSTEVTAVVLVLLAATIAGLALRRWGRRIVGAIGAVAAGAVTVAPLALLLGTPDSERVSALLMYDIENNDATITTWSDITSVDTAVVAPLIAVVGAVVAVVGGLLLAVRPGQDAATVSKYEKASQRKEKIEQDLEAEPQSGRVLWDAIDADIDPTEDNRYT